MAKRFTNDEKAALKKLYSRGITARRIGELLGRSIDSIHQQAHRLGVRSPLRNLPIDEAKIISLYKKNLSLSGVARETGHHPRTVSKYLNKAGITDLNKKKYFVVKLDGDKKNAIRTLYLEGVSRKSLATTFGVTTQTIHLVVRGMKHGYRLPGRPMPDRHEEYEAKVLLEHGFEPHDIADSLNISRNAVERLAIKQLGIRN